MEELNFLRDRILCLVPQYIAENNGRTPYRKNQWFIDKIMEEGDYQNEEDFIYKDKNTLVSNAKKWLREHGYTNEKDALTEKGQKYIHFKSTPLIVQSTVVCVQGMVKAGPADNDVHVEIDELREPSGDILFLPDVPQDRECFAVKVEGKSMEEMGIFSGDYVIVEIQNSMWKPEPNDMIVTRYLPHDPNRSEEYEPSDDDYVGPVVKVYKKKFGERGYQLGWRKFNERNPYSINADALKPIGKVIGVYRDYRKSKPTVM